MLTRGYSATEVSLNEPTEMYRHALADNSNFLTRTTMMEAADGNETKPAPQPRRSHCEAPATIYKDAFLLVNMAGDESRQSMLTLNDFPTVVNAKPCARWQDVLHGLDEGAWEMWRERILCDMGFAKDVKIEISMNIVRNGSSIHTYTHWRAEMLLSMLQQFESGKTILMIEFTVEFAGQGNIGFDLCMSQILTVF